MRDIIHQLLYWAESKPTAAAFLFLASDGTVETRLSFGELAARSEALADVLRRTAAPGERAALMFGPGVDFIVAFMGCLMAGLIAVPMPQPRRLALRDPTDSILENARPLLLLTTSAIAETVRATRVVSTLRDGLRWLEIDRLEATAKASMQVTVRPEDIAFLQYTSGSTSNPKGVAVTHSNLASNLVMMQRSFGTNPESVFACWMPLFHDMGLIANALHAIAAGVPCVLMAPLTFMQRPLRWLRAISDHGVDFAGGPNFAFDHCVDRFREQDGADLHLAGWRIAFNGAEPVRPATLERFARTFAPFGFDRRALFPCYGMAEATVMISGKSEAANAPVIGQHESRTVVSCGSALNGEQIAIVDPSSGEPREAGVEGEIWVRGPHVASGYWCNEQATYETFHARLALSDEEWLRTGDLGFVGPTGELFVTGRLKDLIIVRGENHHPQDLELSASLSHPALHRQTGAVFTAEAKDGQMRLIVVHEADRRWRGRVSGSALETAIREAVSLEHGVAIHRVALVVPGVIPRTTSGKIRRARTRELWLEDYFGGPNGWEPLKSTSPHASSPAGVDTVQGG